jgi:hypothetical protein
MTTYNLSERNAYNFNLNLQHQAMLNGNPTDLTINIILVEVNIPGVTFWEGYDDENLQVIPYNTPYSINFTCPGFNRDTQSEVGSNTGGPVNGNPSPWQSEPNGYGSVTANLIIVIKYVNPLTGSTVTYQSTIANLVTTEVPAGTFSPGFTVTVTEQ